MPRTPMPSARPTRAWPISWASRERKRNSAPIPPASQYDEVDCPGIERGSRLVANDRA